MVNWRHLCWVWWSCQKFIKLDKRHGKSCWEVQSWFFDRKMAVWRTRDLDLTGNLKRGLWRVYSWRFPCVCSAILDITNPDQRNSEQTMYRPSYSKHVICSTTPHNSLLSEKATEQAIWLMEIQLANVLEQLFCSLEPFVMGSFRPL